VAACPAAGCWALRLEAACALNTPLHKTAEGEGGGTDRMKSWRGLGKGGRPGTVHSSRDGIGAVAPGAREGGSCKAGTLTLQMVQHETQCAGDTADGAA